MCIFKKCVAPILSLFYNIESLCIQTHKLTLLQFLGFDDIWKYPKMKEDERKGYFDS